MEILVIILFYLFSLLIRLPHFLILIPASINFRRLAISKNKNKIYLLWTIIYLFLGLFISFAFVILVLNKGWIFLGPKGNILRNEGFFRWIRTIDSSNFELADFQFLETLLIFYLSAVIYTVFIYFIKKKNINFFTKSHLLNLIFGFVFIVIGAFILYTQLPIAFEWGIRANYISNLILFFSMWILFAWPATKGFNKNTGAIPTQKEPTQLKSKLPVLKISLPVIISIVIVLTMLIYYSYKKSYTISYRTAAWSPDSNKVFYLEEKNSETQPFEQFFFCSFDLTSKEQKTIREFMLPNTSKRRDDNMENFSINNWAISKDGVIVYTSGYCLPDTIVFMSLKGDVINTLEVENVFSATWSFDGNKIVYEIRQATPYRREIWVMDKDGSNKIKVENKGWNPCFSPCDYKLVYGSEENEISLIKVVELENGNVKIIKEWKAHDIFLEGKNGEYFNPYYSYDVFGWTPDGQAVIISDNDEFYRLDLFSDRAKRLNIQEWTGTNLSPDIKKAINLARGLEIVNLETGKRELFLDANKRYFFKQICAQNAPK